MNQTTLNDSSKIYTWEQLLSDTTGSVENPDPNPRDIAKLKKKENKFFKFDDE